MLDYLVILLEASKMVNKVRPDIIKERNRILREISKKHYAEALKRQVGKTVEVISEHRAEKSGHYWGITDNYLKVALPSGLGGGKEIITLKITKTHNQHLTVERP